MAADGRALQDVTINDNFAKLSESLYIAERSSREGIAMRQEVQKRAAQKEKERKEEVLRKMAQRARDERAGIRHELEEDDMDGFEEREALRRERNRERTRERNIANAAPAKKTQLQRNKERDVSERIALGLPAPNTQAGEYDTRLFGQTQGLSSGFDAEDRYDVYDKPLRGAQAQSIYKPTRTKEIGGDEEYENIVGDISFLSLSFSCLLTCCAAQHGSIPRRPRVCGH